MGILATSSVGQISVVHIVAHALYNALNVVFGIFGLRPVYALYLLGVMFLVGIVTQIRSAIKGRSSWTFDPSKTPKAEK